HFAAPVFPKTELTAALWHRRFAHLGHEQVQLMLTKNYATGITYKGSHTCSGLYCIPCLIGKRARHPFDSPGNRASQPAELLHIDV
ncbi:hypothetical protein EV121DRAFT_177086, partial [Schizophyllum commune]